MVRVPGRYSVRMNASKLAVGRLHGLLDDADRLRTQIGLLRLRDARHLPKWRVKQTRLRCALGDRGERGVAPLKRYPRRRKPAPKAAAHFVDLFAKVPRDVPHLRKPVAVILQTLRYGPARGVTQIGPEGGVGIDGHLIVTKALVRDQRFDLRAVHVVIQLLGGREPGARDRVELAQHILPCAKPHLPASAGRPSADDPESASAESSLSGNCCSRHVHSSV